MNEGPLLVEDKVAFTQEQFDVLSKIIDEGFSREAEIKNLAEFFENCEGLEVRDLESIKDQLSSAGRIIKSVENMHAQLPSAGAAVVEAEIKIMEGILFNAAQSLKKIAKTLEDIKAEHEEAVVDDNEVLAVAMPEVLPTADLGSLYAEADIGAIKKTDKFGEVVFKDHREVIGELKQVFTDKGFTLDGREDGLLEYVRGSLTTIKNYEKILKRDDLSDESRDKFQNLLMVETNMFLREVAAFLQTERRDEAVGVRSESLPEAGVQDVEAEIASSVAEFESYENLKTDSPILTTVEFINMAAAIKAVRENPTNKGGDEKVFTDIRRIYRDTLEKKLRALRTKAEELGGLAALTTVESAPAPVAALVEPATPADPEPIKSIDLDTADNTSITIEEKISSAIDAGTEFYQSLPAEFFESSESIKKLDAAVAGLADTKQEPSQVTKAILVATFANALDEARAEYLDWQKQKAQISSAGQTPAKVFDDSLPESINPYEMDLLKEPKSIDQDLIPTLTDVVEPEGIDIGLSKLSAESGLPEVVANSDDLAEIKPSVSSEPIPTPSRTEVLLKAKDSWRTKEAEFNNLLKAHYDSEDFLTRLTSAKKVLGINQDLPPALEVLRQESREARALYAKSLNTALQERANNSQINNVYDNESDNTRLAFARKFVLKPQEAQLAMQQRIILNDKQRALFKSVMVTAAKHKWLVRTGVVAAAAVSGGLVSGTWKATQIAASAYFGAAAAKNVHDYFAPQVAEANQELADVSKGIVKSGFSIEHLVTAGTDSDVAGALDKVGGIYGDRLVARNKVVTKQKIATAGEAIAVGGVAGGVTSYMDAISAAPVGVSEGVSSSEMPTNTEVAAVGVAEAAPTPGTSEFIVESVRGPVAIESMSIAQYTPAGDIKPPLVLNNISFGPGSNMAAIPEAQKLAFIKEMRVLASDISPGGSHIPESRFEALLFEKIQAKFGQSAWWNEAGFTKVDVGNYPEQVATTTFTPTEIMADATPVVEVASVTESVVEEVIKGDTVSEILLEKFGNKFEGMSAIERGQVLDRLFARLDKNPELLKELGLRSGDIDLIYPDEKLNLTVLERELDVELKPVAVEEPVAPRTGVLKVNVDAETRSVPVTIKETAVPEATKPKVTLASAAEVPAVKAVPESVSAKVSTESPVVKVKYEPLSFPKVTALNGQYLEHPQFIKLQEAVFDGNAKGYDRAVSSAIEILDRNTYDFTDTLFGSRYSSPYTILNDMSLEEFEKFQVQPNEKLRYDLQQNNVKYETYLQWVDLVQDMKKELPYQASTTIGDMFGRLVLDEAVAKHNINLKVKTA